MLEALEHAKMQDRFEWLRETSFTGSIFNVDSTVDRAPVEGTHVAHVDIAENVCHTGHIGPLNNVTAGAASAEVIFLSHNNFIYLDDIFWPDPSHGRDR